MPDVDFNKLIEQYGVWLLLAALGLYRLIEILYKAALALIQNKSKRAEADITIHVKQKEAQIQEDVVETQTISTFNITILSLNERINKLQTDLEQAVNDLKAAQDNVQRLAGERTELEALIRRLSNELQQANRWSAGVATLYEKRIQRLKKWIRRQADAANGCRDPC
jgi:chromosome segregation ATPase